MRIEAEHTAALVIDYQEKLVPVMHEKEKFDLPIWHFAPRVKCAWGSDVSYTAVHKRTWRDC